MKRFFLLAALGGAVALLSACPDTKLPSPAPKVPEPKAQSALLDQPSGAAALNRRVGRLPAAGQS